jgi:S1-C subfamily serine protease
MKRTHGPWRSAIAAIGVAAAVAMLLFVSSPAFGTPKPASLWTDRPVLVLEIDATGLPVVPLGAGADVQVGEPVMAIGNPFGLEQTVTTGIVSANGRVIGAGPYDSFIQTDAVESLTPRNAGEAGVAGAPGVLVRGVEPSSRAARAGIQASDVIAEIDHQPVATAEDFERRLRQHPAGAPVLVLVPPRRGGLVG